MEQGELKDVLIAQEQARVKALADELDRLCKEVAYSVDRTELANANDVTHQAMSKMLNSNGGQSEWGLKYVPSLALKAPDKFAETVLFFLENLCGRDHPDKKRDLTPEEELKQLKQTLREMQMDQHPKIKGLI
jgi:predicted translin family RNA/ssDNA-binding protein